jgi:hypothetical protein
MSVCCSVSSTSPATLGPESRDLYRYIELLAGRLRIDPPLLLSQCRSAEKQLTMQLEWDRGNREGLATRPADPENSNHVPDEFGVCRAFDLGNSHAWLRMVGAHVSKHIPWAEWGGTWFPPDLPHFQVNETQQWRSVASFRI